jgi:hypothetical protein
VIAARNAACAANTPWNLVKCTRGGGTSAAKRAMKSKGSSTMCVVPSRYGQSLGIDEDAARQLEADLCESLSRSSAILSNEPA